MKLNKEFKKVAAFANVIREAKEQAKDVILNINDERTSLDTLESDAKAILKL